MSEHYHNTCGRETRAVPFGDVQVDDEIVVPSAHGQFVATVTKVLKRTPDRAYVTLELYEKAACAETRRAFPVGSYAHVCYPEQTPAERRNRDAMGGW